MLLQTQDHILFYGDSITDCGRSQPVNNGLGTGYASMAAANLLMRFPEYGLSFTNRGISGNRVYDLEERLHRDVIALQPNIVTIMIGINDTWRRYDSSVISPIEKFEASYRRILLALRDRVGAKIVVMEPFLLPTTDDRRIWREDFDPRVMVVRELANEFAQVFIPLDGLFAAALCKQSVQFWAPDGVHPSMAGHALIAEQVVNALTQ